jgi:outer membrane protein assembly factor BamB
MDRSEYWMKYSFDEKQLVLVSYNCIYLFNTHDGSQKWSYSIDKDNTSFKDIFSTPNLNYMLIPAYSRILIDGNYNITSEYIYLFNKSGNILWHREYPPGYIKREGYNKNILKIRVSDTGRMIMINTKDGMQYYNVHGIEE